MRRVLLLLVASPLLVQALHAGAPPVVRYVEFDAAVTPATAVRILRAIDDAEAQQNDLVLIRLDTPGGLVAPMETIVKRMLDADVPVVVWVGPGGAKAASAGFFLLIAADVAAMAPGTTTGAAATVFGMGESTPDDVRLKKANEVGAALIRSIAGARGRNKEACERAVFSAKAYEETVALEEGLIELIARDRDDLLEQLDGREVRRFDGSSVTLHTAGATFVVTQFAYRQRVLEFLGTPEIAALLLLVGLAGLYVEFTHPGLVFPAVVGVLCLILFAFSAQVLPVSTVGVLLILLAIVMFLLEIKVPSFGMLTVGGALCLIIGSMLLIEGPIPELRVPAGLVLPVAISMAALCALVVRLAVGAQRARVDTGVQGLTGEVGTVTEPLAPEGKVFVHGEIWNAATVGGSVDRGARVRVVEVQDLRLKVEPLERPDDGGS